MDETKTLILTVGLPRSGKSTWARQQGHPIVNPDSIRLALHGRPFIAEAESFVWAIAKTMVRALFSAGHNTVIVDATNTTRKRRDEWKSVAAVRKCKMFLCDTGQAKQRAAEQYPADQACREGLLAAIDRMAAEFEPPSPDEGMEFLV